ncbi:site-specific DNA-methyltransferase [Paraburkholderia sp. Tr-20389]|uniref:site-specific DNA-methyltransferase n=1 Tax=Paraburkholderia sp. Tr-20389 TaxID=2703903 RepID=UPI00197E7E28|nr:site-specific DNA-methyltransferase [Paraburkholderia sp. Tr-20389]MBN3758547.1 site-specific DNA-methyltransferase [Paraburkholderia sp. Tr-20389]
MSNEKDLLTQIDSLGEQQLRRLLVEHLTRRKLGLYWESNAIERDEALNSHVVLPTLDEKLSNLSAAAEPCRNLIVEGDNFDALRLLTATHRGKVRVIYIDPPYNTGNKDWVYNDHYVGANDRWRHSQWLEFLYRRLTLARELLTPDGVILVSINDENRARLELLLEEVMPGRRLGTITWRTRQGSNADQRCFLSVDHEHILVYGNSEFRFKGFEKTYEMYSNPDSDPRGDWRPDNLTLGFSYRERPNLFYPLTDPRSGVSYPPNPDRVWVYATEQRLKPGQRVQAKTMEEFIALGQIIFPSEQRIETWHTIEALLNAIDKGDVPKSGKTPLLRRDLPNLEYWVGRPVGFGRPQFKRYKADLRNQTQPLSSWIVPSFEEGDYEAENSLISGTNQEGARAIAELFGDRAFNYAKPLSLIKGLLAQATKSDDIVLDFFAGSGTTGQAVMELNAEDGGARSFILCSSTEATAKEPKKNLCRDVCAERIRRVAERMEDGKQSLGQFAYLRLDLLQPADIAFDATSHHAFHLLGLRERQATSVLQKTNVLSIGGTEELAILVCPEVDNGTLETLATWPANRLSVYSPRPETVEQILSERGLQINSYSLLDALLRGQTTVASN